MEEKSRYLSRRAVPPIKSGYLVVSHPNISTNQEIGTKIIRDSPQSLRLPGWGWPILCGGKTHGLHISKVASEDVPSSAACRSHNRYNANLPLPSGPFIPVS